MRSCRLLGVVFAGILTGAMVQAAEPAVTIDLPADFPLGLPTVVAGNLDGEPRPGVAFELSHPDLAGQTLLGQCDAAGTRVWVALTASKEIIGKPLRFTAAKINGKPLLRTASAESLTAAQRGDVRGAVGFLEGPRPVLFYQRKPVTQHDHTRAGFVHPLRGLDGETFTEIFPRDHRHHQGVFWAWHQLWVGGQKIGDPWITKDFLVDVQSLRETNRGPLLTEIVVEANWISPRLTNEAGAPRTIIRERTKICLFRRQKNSQYVDFTIQLTPQMPDVKLGGSEDVKGYSGFTVRIKPPVDLVIQDESGVRVEDAVQTTSRWADVSGSFGTGKRAGVGILSHPSLPQFPPRWLLRHYGMQNVAYPGRKPVALSRERPLTLRHRLALHRGNAEEARVADHQQIFALTP